MGTLQSFDRRRLPRIGIGLRVVEVDGEVSYFQFASNLSENGMFLAGCLPREVGAHVVLTFLVPRTGVRVVVAAEVVGNQEAPRGTSFRFIDDEDSPVRVLLREFIRGRMAA
jgi:hypothetical protein